MKTTLLTLPAEIRNEIWTSAVVSDEKLAIEVLIKSRDAVEPGLLRACRQTRREAHTIYYHWNTFRLDVRAMTAFQEHSQIGVHEHNRLIAWLLRIGLQARSQIQRIEVVFEEPMGRCEGLWDEQRGYRYDIYACFEAIGYLGIKPESYHCLQHSGHDLPTMTELARRKIELGAKIRGMWVPGPYIAFLSSMLGVSTAYELGELILFLALLVVVTVVLFVKLELLDRWT